uniref:Uncharacterized protein n=1 Tax=Theileria annulata TaxID=5874 RepID=A0A3B0NDN1_THEAN
MSSISEQLASFRDVKNKKLRRFLSEYRSKLPWNTCKVSNSYNYLRSLDESFEKYESLFSDSLFGLSSLSFSDTNENNDIDIFRESKDIEFMTSEELSEVNKLIGSFIQHTVQYFLNENTEILLDYLIFKYDIASRFREQLIASYIQYYNSPYYCKLLSLITIENGTAFYPLYERIKDVTEDFSECKYVTLNLVVSEIVKSFSIYKQVSTCYNKLSRSNSNAISFFNFVNAQYIITNGPTIDDNELRYIINMIIGGLTVDNIEYLNSQMCSMISLFSSVQLQVSVQNEIIKMCKLMLNKIVETDLSEYGLVFRNFVLVMMFMLHNQTQTLEKLPHEITIPLVNIINKKSVGQVFLDIKESKRSLDFSIFTNTLFHSLVSYFVQQNSEQIIKTLQTIDYENRIISDIKNLLQFVKETDLNCVKQIVFKIVYELNKINSRIKTHNESMITFRIDGFELALNPKIKYLPTVLLLGHSIEILRDLSPNILERTLMEYINKLDYEQLKRNIEVILYIYHRKSNNLSTIIMMLYNRYANQLDNFKPIKLDKLDSIHTCLTIFEEIELQTLKDSVIDSFIDIIVSTYESNLVPEFNYYLSNFLNRLNEYPELFSKLYSNERFISSIPSVYSLNSILLQIQRIIEEIDSSYQCELDGKLECENIEELLMSKYVTHILNNKKCEDLFKKFELFFKVYSASDESTKKIVSEFISPYIHFIKSALNYNDSEYKDIFTVNLVNMVDTEDLVLNNLIKLMNNGGNNDVYVDVGVDKLSGLFTPFCVLFYLVKSIEQVIKSCSDVQYMQMVLIMELLSKYVKSDVSGGIKSVVYEVYGLIFGKYELKLCELHSKLNPLITVKRIQIILNDEQLYNQFKGHDLRVNEYSQYVFELFRIIKSHKEFKVLYKQGKIELVERFKHFMSLEYDKILKDNTVIQYLSKNVEYNECGDGEDGNYYKVNLDYSVQSIDNGCDFVIRLFKNCSNDSSEVYLDLLIRILDLIYTATSEYLGQFTKLVYELSNEFKNKSNDRLTNKVTKKVKSNSVDMDIKCDVRQLVNEIIGQDISVQGYEHNLISVIENNVTGDEQLFKAFMIKFFTSGSKCVFNTVFAEKVIELIDGSGFQVSFLLKILYQIGLKIELELESCKIWNELALVRLGEFLSTSIVLLQTKKVDENEQEFGVLTNLIIKLGTKYKKWEIELKESEQKFDNMNLVKFLSNHVDDTCLVVLNKYKSGIFWKLGEDLRNSIYGSFLQLSKYSRSKYINMSLEWLFKFKESDENMILVFLEQLIRTKLQENVITNLVRNLQLLKSYEVLVQKLLSSTLRSKIKLLNLCKIIHHFAISRNLSNEDFQFIFRNTNILLEHYCKIENSKDEEFNNVNQSLNKQANSKKKTSFVTGIINLITRHKVETEVVQTEPNDTELDDNEDIELFNSIVMYLKQLLERLYTMFGKIKFEKSIYNSLYHGVCSFINKSIVLMGADSVKFINKLIHNLMVCDVRISLDNKELEEVVRNTVTSTVNNILNFDENTPSVVLELLNGGQGKFDLVRTIYTSYLIYTYIYTVIRIGNCTNAFKFPEIFQLVKSGEYFSILSTLVFINLRMLAKNEILDKLKGYQILDFKVKNRSTGELEQVSTQVFRLISELLEEQKIRIQVDQSLFNKKSSTAILFMKINEFLYSLISSMVYYKHYYEKQDNPKTKITESIRTGGYMRYEGYEIIMKLILEIFRINSVGGFNLHVYGILMCIYKELEKISDIITSDELSRILHERYDENCIFKWDVYVITNLLWLNKQSISKENVMRFKYEKEFDKVNNLTCQIMFELFKISSKIYEVDRNENLFNQITYLRNEVWMYFITNTPSCMDYFLPIIVESLDKFELFYLENRQLDWSCLDTVYSLKLIISISKSKSGIGINYNHTIIEISEKIMKMEIGSNLSDFIQILMLLLCYLLLKYFKVSLKKGFYEFCIQMALEFKSREINGKVECIDNSNDNLDNLIENEFMGLNIDDCLNLLENTNTMSLKSLRSELLITQITYYASQSIELKSLIKLFSNQEQLVKMTRLIKIISVNIRYLKPDNHEDLRNIYLICVNYYNTVSSQILSEQGLILYNRTKNKSIEEILENSTKLASIFFNKSGVHLIFNFEESFLSFSINYFSLISPNSLVDLFEKQSKIYEQERFDLGNRIFLLVTLSAICEYGKYGATNLISTRLSQHFEHISEHILNEAKYNRNNIQEITFDNCLLWYKNSKLLLELVVKSIDTWNIKRGSVPDVVLNSWCKIVKNHISILDYLPINGDVEVQNITFELSNSIEKSLIHLINGFITQDNKIIKIESCLSEQLAMKSLNIKIGCLVIMNHIWDELGVHLTPAIKNVMPLLGELVDDENEVVRRIALEVDSKVKEILYQN